MTQPATLFFAVLPDDDVAADIERFAETLRHQYDIAGTPIDRDRLHVTLAPLGAVDLDDPDQAMDAIARGYRVGNAILGSAFDVTFDQMTSLSQSQDSRHPIALSASRVPNALKSLRKALFDLLGYPPERFKPHITLFWDHATVPTRALETTFTWRVREFVLIRSLYGKSHHDRLQVWPLTFV
jgi:2'-5' RNA ligase